MRLSHQLRQFRIWLSCGGELLWIRIRMLRLDSITQMRRLGLLLIAITVAATACFLGFISLLFGLNSILPPAAKTAVFFTLTLIFIVLTACTLLWAQRLWRQQSRFMENTFNAIAEDINCLRNSCPHPPPQGHRHD